MRYLFWVFLYANFAVSIYSSETKVTIKEQVKHISKLKYKSYFINGSGVEMLKEKEFPAIQYYLKMQAERETPASRSVPLSEVKKHSNYLGYVSCDYKPGQKYKLSFYAKSNNERHMFTSLIVRKGSNTNPEYIGKEYFLSKKWKRYTFVYDFPVNKWTNKNTCNIVFVNTYGEVYISNISFTKYNESESDKKTSSGIKWTSNRKNILINSGFELSWQGWMPNIPAETTPGPPVEIDMKIKESGEASMRIPPYNTITTLRYNIDPKAIYTLSFYIKGKNNINDISTNEQPIVAVSHLTWGQKLVRIKKLSNQWKRYFVSFRLQDIVRPEKAGKTSTPLDLNTFYVRVANKKHTIWVDSFQIEKGDMTPYESGVDIGYKTSLKDAIYTLSDKGTAKVLIHHKKGLKQGALLTCKANNVYGKSLWSKSFKLNATDSDMSILDINFPLELGVINFESKLTIPNGISSQGEWRLLCIDNREKFKNSMIGYQNDGIGHWPLWLISWRANILDLIGTSWCKVQTNIFTRSSQSESKYTASLRDIGKINKSHDVKVFGALNFPYDHPLNHEIKHSAPISLSKQEEEKLASEYADRFHLYNSKFKEYFDFWYVLNEPNLYRDADGKPFMPATRLAKFFRAIHAKNRKNGTDYQIYGNMNGTDDNYLTTLLENNAHKYIDNMMFHSYRVNPESPPLYEDIMLLRKRLDKYNKKIGLINGEQYYGLRTPYMCWGELGAKYCTSSEKDHAGRMVQNFLHNIAAGVPICFFNVKASLFKYGGVNPVFYYSSLGGLRNASKLLVGVQNGRNIDVHSDIRSFLFETPNGTKIVSLNTKNFDKNGSVELPKNCSYALDFNGNKITGNTISINWLPSYLVFDEKKQNTTIINELKRAEYKGLKIPLNVIIKLSDNKDSIKVTLSNPYQRNIKGIISFADYFDKKISKNFDLAPHKKESFDIKLPANYIDWKKDIRFDYSIQHEDMIESYSYRIPTIGVSKSSELKEIDGDLTDWENTDWLEITDENIVRKSAKKAIGKNDDFSAKAALAWDNKYFYIAVSVKDSERNWGKKIPGKFFLNDSIQLYFDEHNNAQRGAGYDGDDVVYQIGIGENNKPIAWLEMNPAGRYVGAANLPKGIDGDVKTALSETKFGYVWEIAIPRDALPYIKLDKGQIFGFSLTIHDKDNKSKRSYSLGFSGKTNYLNPYLWKAVKLKD